MIKRLLVILPFLWCCVGSQTLHAQTYPVQVNTQLIPPYTPYLSDYTAVGAQNFLVNLIVNDPTLAEYRCKLRLTIEGVGITIRTKQTFTPTPLILPGGGVPTLLYGEDLLEYFDPQNLDFAGMTRSDYQKGAQLADGVYRFSIEVLDYNRGTVVSNTGTAVAWIVLNDPPLQNLPTDGYKVAILDPTNIAFTWTPRHTGSPNSAFTSEYVFRLVEIWPDGRNPYDAILSEPALYEETTSFTQLVYGPSEPALIPGRQYAWQVQARDVNGRDLFKNDGKSEVFVFQFGDALGIPDNVYLQSATSSALTVRWNAPDGATSNVSYRLRYRPEGAENWYETTTTDQWVIVSQLSPLTTYDVQVRAEDSPQTGEYSTLQQFSTLEVNADAFVCNADVPSPPTPDPTLPTFDLSLNDTIHAGGYKVLVREVSGTGGKYTGAGMAIVPYLSSAKVRVTFEDIHVNDQFWLTAGEIKSVWNADSKFLVSVQTEDEAGQEASVGDAANTNTVETDSIIVITGAAIVAVEKNEDGDVVVYTSDGEQQVLESGISYSVVDEVGNGYIIDEEGNITKTTAEIAQGASDRGDRTYDIAFNFEKGSGRYGFDKKQYSPLASYYQQLADGTYVPWKAVSTTASDVIQGTLEGEDYDVDKLTFQKAGADISAMSAGSTFTLNVQGVAEGSQQELVALYQATEDDEQTILGKVILTAYDEIQRKVVIVPVNDATWSLPQSTIQSKLNAIYQQAVATWEVEKQTTALQVPALDGAMDDGESGLLSNYTDDMKAVINAYGSLENNVYYLFLIDQSSSGSVYGFMPRSKQAGFIFMNPHNGDDDMLVNTVAHELGHGAFNLKHTFDEFPAITKGSTLNLMDYKNSTGTELYKYQWDYVHNPQSVLALFEDSEDAELAVVTDLTQFQDHNFQNEDGSFTFLSPGGRPVTLPARASSVVFATGERWQGDEFKLVPIGTVVNFTVDETSYSAKAFIVDKKFGYYSSAFGENYVDTLTQRVNPEKAIVGYPCLDASGDMTFSAFQQSFVQESFPEGQYLAAGSLQSYSAYIDYYLNDFNAENTASIVALHNLSDEAQEYLSFRKDLAGCGDPLAPYVFINAYQITYNPGSYNYCEMEADYRSLNPLLSYLDNLPLGGYTETQTQVELSPIEEYYNDVATWTNGVSRYKDWTEALKNLNTLADITDVDELVALCQKFSSISCVWEGIELTDRLYAINKLLEGSVNDYWLGLGNNKENLFYQMLKSTPVSDRMAVLAALEDNENELLFKAYGKLDFSINDDFVALLTQWVLSIKSYEVESVQYLQAIPNIDGTYTYPDRMYGWRYDSPSVLGTVLKRDGNNLYRWAPGDDGYTKISPFDVVKIEFNSNFPGGIEQGHQIIVPAIWGYEFQQELSFESMLSSVRVLLDAAVIVSTLGTGTGVVAGIEITLAGTDIMLTAEKDLIISQFDGGEEFYQMWDNAYAIYGLYAAGLGLKQILNNPSTGSAVSKLSLKFSFSEIFSNFENIPASAKATLNTSFKTMAETLKRWGAAGKVANWSTLYYKLVDLQYTLDLQTIYTRLASTSTQLTNQLVLQVKDYTKVVGLYLTLNYEIGRFSIREGDIVLSELRWLPVQYGGEVQSLGTVKPAVYESRFLQDVKGGQLEMIYTADGIFVREIAAGLNVTGVTRLIEEARSIEVDWGNINSVKELIIFKDKSAYSALDFWNAQGDNFYDLLVDNTYYIKYDADNGRVLFGNIEQKKIYGFYLDEGRINSEVTTIVSDPENQLGGLVEALTRYHEGASISGSWSSGAVIRSTDGKTTTILGSFRAVDRYGVVYNDMPQIYAHFGNLKNADFSGKPNGFNLLNVNDAYYEPGVFFEKYNRPWLENAIARGDEIYAASDPMNPLFIYKNDKGVFELNDNGEKMLTGFGKECKILYENKYKYIAATRKFVKIN